LTDDQMNEGTGVLSVPEY